MWTESNYLLLDSISHRYNIYYSREIARQKEKETGKLWPSPSRFLTIRLVISLIDGLQTRFQLVGIRIKLTFSWGPFITAVVVLGGFTTGPAGRISLRFLFSCPSVNH